MADFFVRVELQGATQEDYTLLNARMRGAGYYQAVQAVNGIYKLPTGEYHTALEDPATEVEVRDSIQKLADGVKPGAWVLAIKASRWAVTSQMISDHTV